MLCKKIHNRNLHTHAVRAHVSNNRGNNITIASRKFVRDKRYLTSVHEF